MVLPQLGAVNLRGTDFRHEGIFQPLIFQSNPHPVRENVTRLRAANQPQNQDDLPASGQTLCTGPGFWHDAFLSPLPNILPAVLCPFSKEDLQICRGFMSHRKSGPPLVRTRDFGHEVQTVALPLIMAPGLGCTREELFLDSAKQSVDGGLPTGAGRVRDLTGQPSPGTLLLHEPSPSLQRPRPP